MEQKLNIAEILKGNKAAGTKLWSPLFGDVYFRFVSVNLVTVSHHDGSADFYLNAKLYDYDEAEPTLFPSKEMRDWSKFAWKKGDVLVSNDGSTEVIFDRWYDDTYTNFYGKHYLDSENENNIKYFEGFLCTTEKYFLEDKDVAQTYINTIEERLDGKLNRETLEIEKTQPEFKDGDIAFADYGNRQDVFIVSDKTDLSEGYSSFISLDLSSLTLSMGCRTSFFKKDLCKLRLATEEEKKQLFLALEKKGKVWDADKKMIVDLKPKVELKPFDKVLGRNEKGDVWEAELFSHYREESQYPFRCIGFSHKYCIPYNEETAHLLGTTDDWEGGEG